MIFIGTSSGSLQQDTGCLLICYNHVILVLMMDYVSWIDEWMDRLRRKVAIFLIVRFFFKKTNHLEIIFFPLTLFFKSITIL